jgi:hypothetical protein
MASSIPNIRTRPLKPNRWAGKYFGTKKKRATLKNRKVGKQRTEMLAQMDFPLVSIALSYDDFVPLDPSKMKPLVAVLPEYPILFAH